MRTFTQTRMYKHERVCASVCVSMCQHVCVCVCSDIAQDASRRSSSRTSMQQEGSTDRAANARRKPNEGDQRKNLQLLCPGPAWPGSAWL